mmetsp:Transcript_16928/g.38237  ORF Transcript_16928/g.38237 Transcript_16928/m.38237 type:complete len:371 (+) Transcript_16928:68-1180(+)
MFVEHAIEQLHRQGWASITSYVLLFTLKVSLAASLDTAEFSKRLTRKWPIIFGVACQFVISPACGALIVWLLGMPYMPGVVLLVVTSCPGGCFSNWLCQLVNGDLAMSVAMTGCSTLVGMAMLPTNLYLYTRLVYSKEVLSWHQWCGVVGSVATVFTALTVGLTVSRHLNSRKWREHFGHLGTVCGLLLFVFSVVESSSPATASTPIWRKSATLYMAVSLPVLMATAIVIALTALNIFQLEPPERVAVVIEAVYQNTALGATMALQMFPGHHAGDAMGVVVLYQLCQGATLAIFGVCAHYFHWTLVSPNNTSLWSAFTGNFQQRAAGSLLTKQQATIGQAPADYGGSSGSAPVGGTSGRRAFSGKRLLGP